MNSFDDNRATAIIKRAQEGEMYAEGAMPESETDRVVVAEQLVEQARQVEQIRQMWIDQGKGQIELEQLIPHWPVAESILFEAHVTVGSSNGNQTSELPSAPPQSEEERPTTGQEASAPSPVAALSQQEGGDADAQAAPESAQRTDATEPQSVVETGATTREDPKADEVWADEHGQEWPIVSYSGGPMAIVRHPTTGEKTEVPAGFLKVKVPQTIEDVATDVVPSGKDEWVDDDRVAAAVEDMKSPAQDRYDQPDPPTPDVSIPERDDEDDEEYRKILEETEARYMPEGFPVPHQLENPPTFISIQDLVDLEDIPARTRHLQFNALAARAKLLYAVENARGRDCARARKLSLRGPMRKAREALGSSSTLTERESWAEENHPEVFTWSERARRHSEDAEAYKTFFDMYSENVSVLSRDWTMRDKDRQS